jgi:predicted MFS family arabinose efflux permease
VGSAIAADLIFQIIGTFTVAAIAWRLPFRAMLLASTVIQTVILIAMGSVHTPLAYIAICAVFGMLWLGMNPYQVSLLVDLDQTRQVALVLASLQLMGFGAGPLICSFFVSPGNVAGAFWCAAVLVLLALALYILAMIAARKRSAARPLN